MVRRVLFDVRKQFFLTLAEILFDDLLLGAKFVALKGTDQSRLAVLDESGHVTLQGSASFGIPQPIPKAPTC